MKPTLLKDKISETLICVWRGIQFSGHILKCMRKIWLVWNIGVKYLTKGPPKRNSCILMKNNAEPNLIKTVENYFEPSLERMPWPTQSWPESNTVIMEYLGRHFDGINSSKRSLQDLKQFLLLVYSLFHVGVQHFNRE